MQDIFSIRVVWSLLFHYVNMAHKIKVYHPTVLNQLSFIIAYNLAYKPSNFQAIEMIYPAEITANQDALVCLYSSSYEDTCIDSHTKVSYNQVFVLNKGQKLEFKGTKKGFRTFILAVKAESQIQNLVTKTRSPQLTSYISEVYK